MLDLLPATSRQSRFANAVRARNPPELKQTRRRRRTKRCYHRFDDAKVHKIVAKHVGGLRNKMAVIARIRF